ncbi:MAG: FUSC family protein, partial [Clostridium sp.]|nr:FUSC family protein [Clostridium sp.]
GVKTDNYNIDKDIRKYIDEFRAIVYDNRKERFYLTEEARIKINILSSLEKISINLNKIDDVQDLDGILLGLRQCMKRLNVVLGEDNNIGELENHIDNVISKYENVQVSRIRTIEILNSLEILKVALAELRLLGKENYNKIKNADTEQDKKVYNSVKLSFAVRSAIGISLVAFISDYFNLSEGKWLIFTMVSVIVPIYETSLRKVKDRVMSTIIWVIIIVILFSIFKNIAVRSIIVIAVGYVNSYLSEYKHKTICAIVLAVGSAALLGNTTVLTVNRLTLIAIGIVLAIMINIFILPRKVEDYTRELERMYLEAVKEMLKKVYLSSTENNIHAMNNLFIITSLIESRLENNREFLNKRAIKSISQNRLLILNIHELYILFNNDKFKNIDSKDILEDMKMLTCFSSENIKELLDKIEERIKNSKNIYNKMMLENIREIYKEIYKINKYIG